MVTQASAAAGTPAITQSLPPLPSRLTVTEVPATVQALSRCLAAVPAGARVSVDGSGVQQFDSSALAVLLDLQRSAKAGGQVVQVHNLPQRLVELARVYGVAELLSA